MSSSVSKCLLVLLLSVLSLQQLTTAFLIPPEGKCKSSDNETEPSANQCSWLWHYQRNLGKYRNFYASLLHEVNSNFAVELQELYNTVNMALTEPNAYKKQRLIFYSIWLVERTEGLEEFLMSRGISQIGIQ